MKKKGFVFSLALVAFLGFSGSANASLLTIGTANYLGTNYNLIYEGELGGKGLVWLDYTHVLPYSSDNWQPQVDWASNLGNSLTVRLNAGYKTNIDWSTGWRLPITDESVARQLPDLENGYAGPDATGYYHYRQGYNMLNSELGHLFYATLGNLAYVTKGGTWPQPGWGLQNVGPFMNLKPSRYWSGTLASLDSSVAWSFSLDLGCLSPSSKGIFPGLYALPVHDGMVVDPPSVPVPATLFLLGPGLVSIVAARRRFKK